MKLNKTKTINRLLGILLILVVFLSCKKKHEWKYHNNLEIIINHRTQNKGHLYLLLNNIEENNRSSLKLKESLSGKEDIQKLAFSIDSFDVSLPNYIQIRLSDNVDSLKINYIVVKYKFNELMILGKDLDKYFILQKGVSFNDKNHYLYFEKTQKTLPNTIRLNPNYINYLERAY